MSEEDCLAAWDRESKHDRDDVSIAALAGYAMQPWRNFAACVRHPQADGLSGIAILLYGEGPLVGIAPTLVGFCDRLEHQRKQPAAPWRVRTDVRISEVFERMEAAGRNYGMLFLWFGSQRAMLFAFLGDALSREVVEALNRLGVSVHLNPEPEFPDMPL